MAVELTGATTGRCLVDRVPALRPGYAELVDQFAPEPPPDHIVFLELVTAPLLWPLMDGEPVDEGLLREVAAFLEEMARSGDDFVVGMLETAVLESIEGRPGVERVLPYFGPETMRVMEPFL